MALCANGFRAAGLRWSLPPEDVDLLVPFPASVAPVGDLEHGNMLGLYLDLQLQHVRLQCHTKAALPSRPLDQRRMRSRSGRTGWLRKSAGLVLRLSRNLG